MDDILAHKLAQLRQSPHFEALREYLNREIEKGRDVLESSVELGAIHVCQGVLFAYRNLLKDFEQLELFVQNPDNPNAEPGKDKEI